MVLSDISIRRPVFATVINLVVLLIGIISYTRLPVRQIPNVDTPVVNVSTNYPGANAQVVESQVTQPIEEALSGVEGIEYMQSVSREQSSQVTIRFRLDRDPDGAASDVRDRIGQARDFLPEEVDEPIIQKQEADADPIIFIAFSSDRHSRVEIADYAERQVKDRIQTGRRSRPGHHLLQHLRHARVAAAAATGRLRPDPGRRRERPARAERRDPGRPRRGQRARVHRAVGDRPAARPSSSARSSCRTPTARWCGSRTSPASTLGSEEERFRSRYNGVSAVPLAVVKQAVANPLDISADIKKMLPEIQRTLPEGMKIEVAFDTHDLHRAVDRRGLRHCRASRSSWSSASSSCSCAACARPWCRW